MTTKVLRMLYHHRTQAKGAEGAHIRGMIDGFRSLGCLVDVVSPPGVDAYDFSCPEVSNSKSVKVALATFAEFAPQPCFEAVEIIYNLPAFKSLRSFLATGEYDYIYERYALNSFVGAKLAKKSGVPLILEVNDATIIDRSRPLFFTKMSRVIEKTVFNQANIILTISNKFKDLIISNYDYPEDKILVLPNGIDKLRFDIKDRDRLNRCELGIPENRIVIGCAGAFVAWHGLEFLVEAIAEHIHSHRLFLLFIGDGPVRQRVEEVARAHNVREQVLFTGFKPPDQVPLYLDLLDICVIPDSNPHGSPMKLFEFMAMGKPVVLPRYQPLLDVLADGKEGLFFTPRDSRGLRDILTALVNSGTLRRDLGLRARALVLEKYTWGSHCTKVLAALDRMA